MTTRHHTVFLLIGLAFSAGLPARAAVDTVLFGDSALFWLHQGEAVQDADDNGYLDGAAITWQEDTDDNGTYQQEPWFGQGWKNTTDFLLGPDFSFVGNAIAYDDVTGALQSVSFAYTHTDSRLAVPGDLMIDLVENSDDKTWDYVVQSPFGAGENYLDGSATDGLLATDATQWRAFAGRWHYGDSTDHRFELARDAHTAEGVPWQFNHIVRTDHPWRVDDGDLSDHVLLDDVGVATYLGLVDFDGWKWTDSSTTGHSKFTLAGLIGQFGIDLREDTIRIGLTVNCANDVVYETIGPQAIPEPGTMFIWSLLAAAGIELRSRRRRKYTSSRATV